MSLRQVPGKKGWGLSRRLRSQGRPAIGLFTDLLQVHVRATLTRRSVELHNNIHVTRGDLSRGRVAATGRLV